MEQTDSEAIHVVARREYCVHPIVGTTDAAIGNTVLDNKGSALPFDGKLEKKIAITVQILFDQQLLIQIHFCLFKLFFYRC